MRGSSLVAAAVAAGAVAVASVGGAGPAAAACHAFEIDVEPATIGEGGTVTVIVSRDAGVNPSAIDVTSVDESAQAGADYDAVQRRVSFTTETEQRFDVAINDDGTPEASETFRLHLSNPSGCAINPNFRVGNDATVTITDDDEAAPTTTAPPAPTTTTEPRSTTTATGSTSTSSSTSSSSSSTSTPLGASTTATTELATGEVADEDDGGGSGLGLLLLILLILLVAAGIGGVVWRMQGGSSRSGVQ